MKSFRVPALIILALLIFSGLLMVGLLGGRSLGTKSYLVDISVEGQLASYQLDSDKDGDLGSFEKSEVSVELSEGEHRITVSSRDYISSTKLLTVGKETPRLTISLQKNSGVASELAKVAGDSSTIQTSRAKYFAGETWLVGLSTSVASGSESHIIVAKKEGTSWQIIEEGSFIDTDYLKLIGAPDDLISYVNEIQ